MPSLPWVWSTSGHIVFIQKFSSSDPAASSISLIVLRHPASTPSCWWVQTRLEQRQSTGGFRARLPKRTLEISGGSGNIFCARSNTNKHRWYTLRIHEDDHRFQFYAWKRRTALSEDCGNLNRGCYGCVWETIKFSGFGRVWRAQSPVIIK